LRDIRDTANLHAPRLAAIADDEERLNELSRLNVAEQVLNVAETTVVQDAWDRGQEICVHGWIYGLKDGRIRDPRDIYQRSGRDRAAPDTSPL